MNLWQMQKILFTDYTDRRVTGYPLIGNVYGVSTIVALYLLFVLKLGPWLMKDRPAFNLRTALLLFNATQMLMCSYIVFMVLKHATLNPFVCMTNQTTSPTDMTLLNVSYMYWLIKLIDLLDTVFFVLRKKFNQISTLHVYHHTLMVICGWIFMKFYPAGELVWLGLLNSIVHVFMYYYYFCSALSNGKIRLWWKKYITHGQILQFIILGVIYFPKLFVASCNYPKILLVFHMAQIFTMLIMFSNFYYRTYTKGKTIVMNNASPKRR